MAITQTRHCEPAEGGRGNQGRIVQESPIKAGLSPHPLPFFAGVMAMGLFSFIGLFLYGRWGKR